MNLNGWIPNWVISKAGSVMPAQIVADFARGIKYFREKKIDTTKIDLF